MGKQDEYTHRKKESDRQILKRPSDGQMQEIWNFYASMQEKNGASLYQRCRYQI